jgi:hypothetical protein
VIGLPLPGRRNLERTRMAPPTPQFAVPFTASGFPAGVITGPQILEFDETDLAHALFVTGRAPGDTAAHGMSSVWEWIHRVTLVPSYVRMTPGGSFARSNLALELDRSEKVALSYALGQAMTGIFCQHVVGVDYLMHVDRYAQHFNVTFGAERKRADLFGHAPNGWVVAEAKGRSNTMENALVEKLEEQKRSVLTVAGAAPWLALGCVASFPTPDKMMVVDAFDPEENDENAIHVEVDLESFFTAYYEPFAAAIDFGTEIDDYESSVIASEINGLGVTVAMPRSIYDALRSPGIDQEPLSTTVGREREVRPAGTFPDGTAISVDWGDALATQDWVFGDELEFR